MAKSRLNGLLVALGACFLVGEHWEQSATAAPGTPNADVAGYRASIAALLAKYCHECHGADTQEGKLALHEIDANLLTGGDMETWRMVSEQIQFGAMPPKEAAQPKAGEKQAILKWIRAELRKTQLPGTVTEQRLSLPQFGNYVDHDALFNEPAGPVIPGPARLWRLRPELYQVFVRDAVRTGSFRGYTSPFGKISDPEIKDYSAIYFVDESTATELLDNAERIIDYQIEKNVVRELKNLAQENQPPTKEQVASAIAAQFRATLRRSPMPAEVEKFLALYVRLFKTAGHVIAGKTMLAAILLQPEAIFRQELGAGPVDALGRRRLAPREIAFALTYALGDTVDEELLKTADSGGLGTREQVAAYVQSRLQSPGKNANTRIPQFFREYFDYPTVRDVFKDKPVHLHEVGLLETDMEMTIDAIVTADRQVLRELLTTEKFFVLTKRDNKTRELVGSWNVKTPFPTGHLVALGLPKDWKWSPNQPIELPGRVGVLSHPCWLAAWSGNFDNHPVQRGKWIRTHLLGGTVPDVPIGVDARVPEDEHKQLRERLTSVTSAAECWRCHKKMDPLGLPFEAFDHYGHLQPLEKGRPVDTTGAITLVGDPSLEGQVKNHAELMKKLAASPRVEQVFVRYVFRYFLGRNETLGDAKTLQEAHRAYRDNDGSFRAVVVSILSSDSFLYRTVEK